MRVPSSRAGPGPSGAGRARSHAHWQLDAAVGTPERIATMAPLPVTIPVPAAPPAVDPGPPALGKTLGIAKGGTPRGGGLEPIFFSGPSYLLLLRQVSALCFNWMVANAVD